MRAHRSAGLVELVARRCGIEDELGVKGKQGILKSKKMRRKFNKVLAKPFWWTFTGRPLQASVT